MKHSRLLQETLTSSLIFLWYRFLLGYWFGFNSSKWDWIKVEWIQYTLDFVHSKEVSKCAPMTHTFGWSISNKNLTICNLFRYSQETLKVLFPKFVPSGPTIAVPLWMLLFSGDVH